MFQTLGILEREKRASGAGWSQNNSRGRPPPFPGPLSTRKGDFITERSSVRPRGRGLPRHPCQSLPFKDTGHGISPGMLSAGVRCRHPPTHGPLPPRSRLDKGLAVLVRERGADLVVIEGMGRAVHTNYHAALRCESLKLAVIKNSWLAERLGGRLFSVIFKYEVPAE